MALCTALLYTSSYSNLYIIWKGNHNLEYTIVMILYTEGNNVSYNHNCTILVSFTIANIQTYSASIHKKKTLLDNFINLHFLNESIIIIGVLLSLSLSPANKTIYTRINIVLLTAYAAWFVA